MIILLAYLLATNLIAWSLMGWDKRQAKRGGYRIPEKRLFTVAILGGALGAWIGMRKFRHKTKHLSFIIGIPSLLVLNLLLVAAIIYFWGNIR